MGLFDAILIAGSGLTAERIRMDVTAENLANAETTRGPGGQPYKRQEVLLAQAGAQGFGGALSSALAGGEAGAGTLGPAGAAPLGPAAGAGELATASSSATGGEAGVPAGGVRVAGIVSDSAPDRQIYDPSSPDANAQGYVRMPNVDTVTEMTDLIDESTGYQADVTAMQTAKSMFTTTLTLLK